MALSMTGFGRCEKARGGRAVAVEARSVNHRHLVLKWRLPSRLARYEQKLEEIARQDLARGSVEVAVRAAGDRSAQAKVDLALARRYGVAIRELSGAEPDWTAVLQLPGVVELADEEGGDDLEFALLEAALRGALDELVAMRRAEGSRLDAELRQLVAHAEKSVAKIEARAAKVPALAKKRLAARLGELMKGAGAAALESGALEREAALLADRADVREELQRLESHFAGFLATLGRKGAIGRALDFTVQELAREANTIGVKLQDAEASRHVVELKTSIERLREQVQNLE